MSRKVILLICVLAKIFLASTIIFYFWNSKDLEGFKRIPVSILILAVLYIIVQLYTRKISVSRSWWDWVYYFGLVSIMISVSLSNENNFKVYNVISDYGTFLLLLPALVELVFLIQDKKE